MERIRRTRHRTRRFLCHTLVASAVVMGATAVTAGAAAGAQEGEGAVPTNERGFSLHPNWFYPPPWGATDAELAREVKVAQSLHADVVRVMLPWNLLAPSTPQWDPALTARLDALMEEIQAAGMKALVSVFGTPCWASFDPRACTPSDADHMLAPCADPQDFQGLVAGVLRHWGAATTALEVWNEPYFAAGYRGTPKQYVTLVHAAAAAVDETGWTGALLAAAQAPGAWPYGSDWLQRLYAAGLSGQDGLSIHPYDFDWDATHFAFRDPREPGSRFESAIQAVRKEMVGAGDGESSIWLTEFGMAVCPAEPGCVSEKDQADWLVGMFALADRRAYIHGSLAFSLRDQADPTGVLGYGTRFGILNQDFSERLAAPALRAALAVPPVRVANPDETTTPPPPDPPASDTSPPETALLMRRAQNSRVVFTLSGGGTGPLKFQCRVDRRPLRSCSGPQLYRLDAGRHVFTGFAIDALGRGDPTPVVRQFLVRRAPRR